MLKEIEPKDVVQLHPKALERVKLNCELDTKLVEALHWGYSLHPEERRNVGTVGELTEDYVIKWPEEAEIHEEVCEAISIFTVPPNLPIAGMAEHLISFRRLLNSTYLEIKNGPYWSYGANLHIRNVLA